MMRLRALAAVLACLAVLASGFMTVVAAVVPSAPSAMQHQGVSAPCSHCDDCDSVPCPMPMASCLQVASNVAPTLPATAVDLTPIESAKVHWSPDAATLSGLSPPPDPYPPRA